MRKIVKLLRKIYDFVERKKINKNHITIISRDCIGGILYKRLNIRFDSPTINLYFNNRDFIVFCENLNEFINTELKEYKTLNYKYPVGILENNIGSVKIYFMHYNDFESAKQAWDKRKLRIHYDNLYIIFDAKHNIDEEILNRFKNIKCKNKIILSSNVNVEKYPFAYNMKCYKEECETLIKYPSKYHYKRYLDEVNWKKFFNNN